MPISDRLDEIRERANSARQVLTSGTTGAPPNVAGVDVYEAIDILAESTADVPALVAALRAVLDVCDGLEEAHRANPEQTYEYGLEEAAHQVRNAVEAALGEES
jgi:hypothetical protein